MASFLKIGSHVLNEEHITSVGMEETDKKWIWISLVGGKVLRFSESGSPEEYAAICWYFEKHSFDLTKEMKNEQAILVRQED